MVYIMKKMYSALLLAAALTLSGCSSHSAAVISGSDASASKTGTASELPKKDGHYTADELKAMAENSPMHADDIADRTAADLSADSVIVYNNLINYATDHLGGDDFHLFDFRTTKDGYYIKIVLDEYVDSGDYEHAPITITSDYGGSRIKSELAGFNYSRKWTESLSAEINFQYPDYHINDCALESDNSLLSIDRGEETYNIYNMGIEPMTGTWSVNIILPAGTEKSDFEKAYDNIGPILRKYSVNQLTAVSPESEESREKLISGETITGNSYSSGDEGVSWCEVYGEGGASTS